MFNPALDHANRGMRQTVQLHTFYAPLLVFDKTLPCFNAEPDIFAVMNHCVVALSLLYPIS